MNVAEYKYVDDVVWAVEDLLYAGHLHIRVERDTLTNVWKVIYE